MTSSQTHCKKQTLYISIAASLIIGFVAGVLYSAYQTPLPAAPDEHNHQAASLIDSLQQQVSSDPDNVEAWIKLGHAYFDSDQYGGAIDAYQKALAINPGNINIMTDMGVMFRRNGQPDKAIETFDKVLEFDPHHEQARFNKGVVLLNDFNDKTAAIKEWKILVINNPAATAPSGTPLKEIIDQLQNDNTSQ